MIHRVLIWASIICCGFVLISFALFARDQVAGASQHQTSELVATSRPQSDPAKPHKEKQPRHFIDTAAGKLESPFHSVVHSSNVWVTHGVATLAALLVYGVGLGFLARYSQGMA